jgi:hypothetical protein
LSPAVLGLAFRDPWSGFVGLAEKLGIDSDDRAALLERAFEVRYATLLAEPKSFASRLGTMIGSDPELANRRGLARPLGYTSTATRWMPLLLLNATSVDTGRRVIASIPTATGRSSAFSPKPTTCSKSFLSATFRCLPQQSLAADSLSSHPMGRFGATIHGVRRNAPLTVATSRTTA